MRFERLEDRWMLSSLSMDLGTSPSPQMIASDADGDYVLVWDGSLGGSSGISAALYTMSYENVYGQRLATSSQLSQVRVTEDPTAEYASVARDADGDFVVVWSQLDENDVQNGRDIYTRVFSASGHPQTEPFRVNTERPDTQRFPTVAIDADGDFVVVWQSYLQDGSGYGIHAQCFTPDGIPLGEEFQVNETTLNQQVEPSVAMSPTGEFVVAWTTFGQDGDNAWESNIHARWFGDPEEVGSVSGEFLVNEDASGPEVVDHTSRSQKWPAVALDSDGDFVVTWTSFGHDLIGSGYGSGEPGLNGVYARRFVGGLGMDDAFLVNSTLENNQQRSKIAMDADGDFLIVWESYQEPAPAGADSYGVFAQRYVRNAMVGQDAALGPDGEIWGQFQVNTTIEGDQRAPAVTIDHGGDYLIAWRDLPDHGDPGLVYRRFTRADDLAQPVVSEVLNAFDLMRVEEGSPLVLRVDAPQMIVRFSEDLSTQGGTGGPQSVLSMANWSLARNGEVFSGGVRSVEFGLNRASERLAVPPSGKFEALITFDNDPMMPGSQTLEPGEYTLIINDRIEDIFGNPLAGGDFQRTFQVVGSVEPTEQILVGSAGDDLFEVIAAEHPKDWSVRINGVPANVPLSTTSFELNGMSGRDTLIFMATDADETVEMGVETLDYSALGCTLVATNFETMRVDGRGGMDTASLTDSAGNDTLRACPLEVSLRGPRFSNRVRNFEQVTVTATSGGVDWARLYDSPGDDVFLASPNEGQISGSGYSNHALGFDSILAYSRAGGLDKATLDDSPGNDRMIINADAGWAKMRGPDSNYIIREKYFDEVYAYANSGGYDRIRIEDSSANDQLIADAENRWVKLIGPDFYYRAKLFDQLIARSTAGGLDTAELIDSPGDDLLHTSGSSATLSTADGPGDWNLLYEVIAFDRITAHGTSGGTNRVEQLSPLSFVLELDGLWQ